VGGEPPPDARCRHKIPCQIHTIKFQSLTPVNRPKNQVNRIAGIRHTDRMFELLQISNERMTIQTNQLCEHIQFSIICLFEVGLKFIEMPKSTEKRILNTRSLSLPQGQ
jgi:hypothetical protein